MTAGNGRDGAGGLTPRFLELKRLVPKMRRWGNMTETELDRMADAPAFVLAFDKGQTIPGDVSATARAAVQAGLAPLPADPCVIEWIGPGLENAPLLVVHVDPHAPDVWIISPWFEGDNGWETVIYTVAFRWTAYVFAFEPVRGRALPPDALEREHNWVNGIVQSVGIAAHLLAEVGSAAVTRSVGPTTRRLMHSKGIRGWQYRMVDVTAELMTKAARAAPQGGTHASPRWHLRRAHLRRLKNGKVVAIRSCEVGTTEHGGIVKDYQLEDPHHEPEPPPPLPRA